MTLPTEQLPGGPDRRASPPKAGPRMVWGGDFLEQLFGGRPCFQLCFHLKVPPIQFIDSGWIFLRRDSSGAALGLVLDMPVVVLRQVPFYGCQGRRHLCRGAEAVSLGPDCSENHSDSPVAVH